MEFSGNLGRRNSVIGGSSRMKKMDQAKGKSADEVNNNNSQEGSSGHLQVYNRRLKTSQIGEKKALKSQLEEAILTKKRNSIQIRKTKSDSHTHTAAAAAEKSIHLSKTKSDSYKPQSPIQISNTSRSDREKTSSLISQKNVPQIRTQNVEKKDEIAEQIKMEIEDNCRDSDVKEIVVPEMIAEEKEEVGTSCSSPQMVASNVKLQSPLSPMFDEFDKVQETQRKFQNMVDLVMWKDISKSAFVFGFGSFLLLSSSLAKDLSFSIVSAISYTGLLYLAATFFYKSILCRANDVEESNHQVLVGEEEAIWLLHFILPYLNGFLFQLKTLFSGDPASTLKLAVILFFFARSGNSITLWMMAKSGFVGVFIVPKVYSLYSTQITKYGTFWIKRFGDAWDTCSNKKVVVAIIFTIFWNLSSVSARVWAGFMLVVAVRYHQQSLCSFTEWEEQEFNEGG